MDEPGLSAFEALSAVVVEEAPHGTDHEAGNPSGECQPQEEPMLTADDALHEANFEVGGLPGDGQARGQQVLDKSPIFTEKERANFERTIFEQSLKSIGAGMPALPWEQGIFKEIFGEAKSDNLPMLEDLVAYPAGAAPGSSDDARLKVEVTGVTSSLPGDMPLYAKHIKALCDRDYAATLDLTWTKALASWLIVLEDCNFESSVGHYVQEKLQALDRDGALLCIRDACGVRSPSTVLKRARDLILFVKWCEKNDLRWWPIKERNLLDYLQGKEDEKRSKFIGKNLIHALKFFKYIIGAEFNIEAVLGPMLTGKVSRVLATRDPTEQARALTVAEVLRLEVMLDTVKNKYDKYFIGCILYAIYSRSRWSDMANIHHFFFDVIDTSDGPFGFVEARTRIHKTSTTAERKAMYMPYVASVNGIGSGSWGLKWKVVLEELGLLELGPPYGPICKAPTVDGGFAKRPVSTSEGTNMINAYLGYRDGDQAATTTHSLKSTLLVWAARYGLSEPVRGLLGHHSLKENSVACYSRDMLSQPTRELCAMIYNIKLGNFVPDGTRSGWMVRKQAPLFEPHAPGDDEADYFGSPSVLEGEKDVSADTGFDPNNPFGEPERSGNAEEHNEQPEEGARDDGDEDGEDFVESASESEYSSASSDNEEELHKEKASVIESGLEPEVKGPLMQNKRSRMLHTQNPDPKNLLQPVTSCGLHGIGFTVLAEGSIFSWPKCSKCFKDADNKSVIDVVNASKRRRI